ncbi:hypothetical protein [Paenibacillus hubeiensis]|uniref:hypothetical protein n=1 Tax=Paenibacillus hubeiensis TaxID=3077330 RepID=UPI0031BAFFE8
MYYFETNALTGLSNVLKELVESNNTIYTSYLSILELISGIDSEEKFLKRKSILQNVRKSNMKIVWKTPRQIIYESYELCCDDTFDIKIARTMFDRILSSESYNKLKKYSDNINEECKLEYFVQYDEEISKAGIDFSKEDIIRFSNAYPKDTRKEIKNHLLNTDYIFAQAHVESEILIRSNLEEIIKIEGLTGDYFQLIKKYDRNLDDYCFVQSFKSIESIIKGNEYGTNDLMDLLHLLYLTKSNMIVTNDEKLKLLIDRTKRFKYIDTESVKNINNP